MKQFLVVDLAGRVIHATPDAADAARAAGEGGVSYQWLAPTAAEVAQMQGAERAYRMANPKGKKLPGVGSGPWAEPPWERRSPIFDKDVGEDERRSVKAARLTALPEVPASVMSMSLEAAYGALRPIFEDCHNASIAAVRQMLKLGPKDKLSDSSYAAAAVAYDFADMVTPGGGFLATNAKLDKRDPERPAVTLGLSLLPEQSAFSLASLAGVDLAQVSVQRGEDTFKREPLNYDLKRPRSAVGLITGATFCAGASLECKRSCLVNTGQNASSMRANYSKLAKAKALLERPYEFMRILGEALHRYSIGTKADIGGGDPKVAKFVRLNVLSDIPWEWVAPWIFDMFPGLRFYDYTKVAGRPFVDNYHLSFSYSGSKASTEDCLSEFRRGRNIVQVYAAPGYVRKQTISTITRETASKKTQALLAISDKAATKLKRTDPKLYARRASAKERYDRISLETWLALNKLPDADTIGDSEDERLALPVVDGDFTDFRPFDPKGVIVGLRWKHPRVFFEETGKRGELNWEDMPKRFVLYGDVRDTGLGTAIFKLPETPTSASDPLNKTEQAVAAIQHARGEAIAAATRAKWKVVR